MDRNTIGKGTESRRAGNSETLDLSRSIRDRLSMLPYIIFVNEAITKHTQTMFRNTNVSLSGNFKLDSIS